MGGKPYRGVDLAPINNGAGPFTGREATREDDSPVTTWIVVIDRPYYPSVQSFDVKADALAAFDEALTEDVLDGRYPGRVYWAEVVGDEPIRTDH